MTYSEAAADDQPTEPATFEVENAWGPQYRLREERGQTDNLRDGSTPCLVCGKAVNPGAGFEVHLVDGGNYALRADLEDTHEVQQSSDMGWWTVGADCAKTIPAAYRHPRIAS